MTEILDVLVVGAGISGLSLAHKLTKLDNDSPLNILVAESQNRVGGNITTVSKGEFLWEEGPNSFSPTPELLKLAIDVGLKEDLIFADRKLPRYVYWNGQLLPVPMSPMAMLQSKLLSNAGKIRALVGALGFVPPIVGMNMSQEGGEETVSQFFQRHLGLEVMERLVEPFVSGVYAGDPSQLSATAAFSKVTRIADLGGGLLPGAILSAIRNPKSKVAADSNIPKTKAGELGSFRGGLEVLPKAIAADLGQVVKLSWRLIGIRRTEKQTYIAEFSTPNGSQQIETRTIALSNPAYICAELFRPLLPKIASAFNEFYYPTVACVVLAYPVSSIKAKIDGFGNLIPRGQGIRTLGTIWSSALFSGRTPPGWQIFTNFIGGATDPEISQLDSEAIVAQVHQDLCQTLLNQDAEQPKVLAVHIWSRAIPQYNLGYNSKLAQIHHGLKSLPGVYLCSNYIGGVALGDCVRRSIEVGTEISRVWGITKHPTFNAGDT
ncbi:MAG: protoporphyrinogen oxidase [Trichodesmium sp. St16_bin4-tuft]|nr:protoporphyrinogen oxidase [Trichodesmium sp. MAG_R01]MDE5073561.1 protoporphyrinogen oxidase [Trichodesmium sp. St5_bin8]MDE5100508.1 protoporphyrinogen oxidase [Trichodesmium sp. St16_bin4-tuft]MDE5101689.1 protoporphyrinogen oxidase [Trichodesmium sp. St19_bin2]